MPRGRNKQIDWDVPIMNVREVADYLRVSISTIYREAKSGTLPGSSWEVTGALAGRRSTLGWWRK
jgi:hypothetical protein